jgi:hypothetical protein
MNVRFFDRGDEANPLNGATIRDARQLLKILQSLRERKPFFCELLGQNGYQLDVGIGPSFGCAQYRLADGDPPYLMAVAENSKAANEYEEFLYQNTPTEVPARYCLPIDTIMAIAEDFHTTGARSPIVLWEEI